MEWRRWIDALRAQEPGTPPAPAGPRRHSRRAAVPPRHAEPTPTLEKGMSDREADRRARVALGGFTQTNERARDVRPLRWLGRLARDVRYTVRSLRRAPGFTTVAVLTIGVAIGACTAMYSVVHGVALRPLPYPSPDRLVHLFQVNKPGSRENFSDPNFFDLRAASSSFAARGGVQPGDDGPRRWTRADARQRGDRVARFFRRVRHRTRRRSPFRRRRADRGRRSGRRHQRSLLAAAFRRPSRLVGRHSARPGHDRRCRRRHASRIRLSSRRLTSGFRGN